MKKRCDFQRGTAVLRLVRRLVSRKVTAVHAPPQRIYKCGGDACTRFVGGSLACKRTSEGSGKRWRRQWRRDALAHNQYLRRSVTHASCAPDVAHARQCEYINIGALRHSTYRLLSTDCEVFSCVHDSSEQLGVLPLGAEMRTTHNRRYSSVVQKVGLHASLHCFNHNVQRLFLLYLNHKAMNRRASRVRSTYSQPAWRYLGRSGSSGNDFLSKQTLAIYLAHKITETCTYFTILPHNLHIFDISQTTIKLNVSNNNRCYCPGDIISFAITSNFHSEFASSVRKSFVLH